MYYGAPFVITNLSFYKRGILGVEMSIVFTWCRKRHKVRASKRAKRVRELNLESHGPGKSARKAKFFQKWLGEGAKGLWDSGTEGLPRVFCTTQDLCCIGATPFRTSAGGLLLIGSKTLVAAPVHRRPRENFLQVFSGFLAWRA